MSKAQRIVLLITLLFSGAVFAIVYTEYGVIVFDFVNYIPGKDKTGHVVLIGLMALSISWVLSFRGMSVGWFKLHYGILLVGVFITIEEFLQMLSPYRSFDLVDMSCNFVGLLVAFVGITVFERFNNKQGTCDE